MEAQHAAVELLDAFSELSAVVDMNDAHLREEVVDAEPGEGRPVLQAGLFENGKQDVEVVTDNVALGVDSEHLTGLMIAHSLEFEDAFGVVLGNLEDDEYALDLAGVEAPVHAVLEAAFLLPGETEVAVEEVVVAPELSEFEVDEVVAVGESDSLELNLDQVH